MKLNQQNKIQQLLGHGEGQFGKVDPRTDIPEQRPGNQFGLGAMSNPMFQNSQQMQGNARLNSQDPAVNSLPQVQQSYDELQNKLKLGMEPTAKPTPRTAPTPRPTGL